MIGAGCVLLALAVAGWVARSMLASVALTVLAAAVTALGALLFVIGVTVVAVRPTMLLLEPSGLRNRTGRAVGVRSLIWTDIADIAWSTDAFGHTLVVALADGRSSRIHTGVLDASAVEVENAIRTHADTAHGYRPLDAS